MLVFLVLYLYGVKSFTVFDDSDSDEEETEKRLVDKMEALEKIADKILKRRGSETEEKEVARKRRGIKLNCNYRHNGNVTS